ncbi:MAG: 4-hydroxy-3-methylbut-2-enyl diphosphate reductase [Pseudonocardia sp.]|nr:4-hydroxy-3-methylbut-2-enyl diphosphate reductase [Pseudonocardia sp.]
MTPTLPTRATAAPRLVVCAPLPIEARALRRALDPLLGADAVLRTGFLSRRNARCIEELLPEREFDAFAVAGLGGGVGDGVASGDVVVASEVRGADRTVPCPSAPLLAGQLRRAGFTVHCGPLATRDHVVHGDEYGELARTGVLAVDMESSRLACAARDRPLAAVRVIVDTPDEPLADWGTPRRGLHALRLLSELGPVLAGWAAAVGPRQALLPAPRSFCAGVDRAIEIVEEALARHGPPVYVRKQIVHNTHVVADLQRRGAVFVDELDEVPPGALTVFSAHGVSPAVRAEAERGQLDVVDATCPLVTKVHVEARRYTREEGTVLFIGHDGHEETEGTLGEAPGRIALVETVEDAQRVTVPDPERVSYLMQTTLSVEESTEIVAALRKRFPALRGPRTDDICYATTNRQAALRAVAERADLVLVVGSANSSNSQRLVETARRCGARAHLVDDAFDVDLDWLVEARTVGVTAGASAPPALVDEVLAALGGLGPLDVHEHRIATESIRFSLPKEVS